MEAHGRGRLHGAVAEDILAPGLAGLVDHHRGGLETGVVGAEVIDRGPDQPAFPEGLPGLQPQVWMAGGADDLLGRLETDHGAGGPQLRQASADGLDLWRGGASQQLQSGGRELPDAPTLGGHLSADVRAGPVAIAEGGILRPVLRLHLGDEAAKGLLQSRSPRPRGLEHASVGRVGRVIDLRKPPGRQGIGAA